MPYKVKDNPLTIHEDWDKSRWREDSIYLEKYKTAPSISIK